MKRNPERRSARWKICLRCGTGTLTTKRTSIKMKDKLEKNKKTRPYDRICSQVSKESLRESIQRAVCKRHTVVMDKIPCQKEMHLITVLQQCHTGTEALSNHSFGCYETTVRDMVCVYLRRSWSSSAWRIAPVMGSTVIASPVFTPRMHCVSGIRPTFLPGNWAAGHATHTSTHQSETGGKNVIVVCAHTFTHILVFRALWGLIDIIQFLSPFLEP